MKRLVVQKGPPKRGGTGPRNKNARKNNAARSQAIKLAKTKAKLSKSLGFLAKGKNSLFSVPSGGVKGGSTRYLKGGKGLAGSKNQKGKNFLAKVTGKNVTGSSSGPIQTRGSRTIASGAVVSDGEINGVAGGRSLNFVQGKVSVKGLHAAGGSGNLSFGPTRSMSTSGNVNKDKVKAILRKHIGKIRYCYERALLSKPHLKGVLKMNWTIVGGGRVSSVRVVSSALNDSTLHNCVSGKIKSINFAGAGTGSVTYPFNFTSSSL
jgi:hypothetical protein